MGQAIQSLPRGDRPPSGATVGFYGVFPGLDGIGADIVREEDVIYANIHRAKVVKFDPLKDMVTIRFNDKTLMPPEMTVPVRDVSYAYGGPLINKAVKCPKCHLPWKETPGFRFSFFDCPSCGMRKEDA